MKNLILLFSLSMFTLDIFCQKNPYDVNPTVAVVKDTTPASDFAQKFPFLKMVDWKQGMRFMTEPLNVKALGSSSRVELASYQSTNFINQQIRQGDFEWKTFTYLTREYRTVKCPAGTCINTYLIFECEGNKYEYEFIGDSVKLEQTKNAYIKKIVYLDEVDAVKELLKDKTLYILTSQWNQIDEKGHIVKSEGNQKLVPVSVVSVGLGTQDGPCKVVFKLKGTEKEYFLNVRLTGINKSTSGLFGIDFDDAFQFEDPKKQYPNIKPEIWKVIQGESMRIGMTKVEAELSWGKPNQRNVNGAEEEWIYDTAGTLIFKNGVVAKIQ